MPVIGKIMRPNGTVRLDLTKRITRKLNGSAALDVSGQGSHYDPALLEGGQPWYYLAFNAIQIGTPPPQVWFANGYVNWQVPNPTKLIYGLY